MWIDDQVLAEHTQQISLKCFIPTTTAVVLGSSNAAEAEVNLAFCDQQKIPVLKRYGGGGTVVLYSGCVVVSAGIWVKQQFQNQMYFKLLNQSIIDVLARQFPVLASLKQRGLSDVSHGNRKIAGTSLFRSRNYLLYQASIVVEPDLALIKACLQHPSKEPDYREGRSHEDFLTSLNEICGLRTRQVYENLEKELPGMLIRNLGTEMVDPVVEQFAALKARLQRSGSGFR